MSCVDIHGLIKSQYLINVSRIPCANIWHNLFLKDIVHIPTRALKGWLIQVLKGMDSRRISNNLFINAIFLMWKQLQLQYYLLEGDHSCVDNCNVVNGIAYEPCLII
jgi:hypothetical protein